MFNDNYLNIKTKPFNDKITSNIYGKVTSNSNERICVINSDSSAFKSGTNYKSQKILEEF